MNNKRFIIGLTSDKNNRSNDIKIIAKILEDEFNFKHMVFNQPKSVVIMDGGANPWADYIEAYFDNYKDTNYVISNLFNLDIVEMLFDNGCSIINIDTFFYNEDQLDEKLVVDKFNVFLK